ncbi:hypothetical protein P692DRAFT_20347339 [Suillus brevipes Sb2]|nr:hypothetical protein P692DRAFT_20347339 [Suillus brevipes Sb2]
MEFVWVLVLGGLGEKLGGFLGVVRRVLIELIDQSVYFKSTTTTTTISAPSTSTAVAPTSSTNTAKATTLMPRLLLSALHRLHSTSTMTTAGLSHRRNQSTSYPLLSYPLLHAS